MTSRTEVEVVSIRDAAAKLVGVVAERQAVGGVEWVGLPTGFHTIDRFTGGLQPDCLWVVGARTSVGKARGPWTSH